MCVYSLESGGFVSETLVLMRKNAHDSPVMLENMPPSLAVAFRYDKLDDLSKATI